MADPVELWRLDARDERVPEAEAASWLDDADHAILARRKTDKARRSFILGRWLIRRALACSLGTAEERIRFGRSALGKPTCADANDHGVAFNLTHAGDQFVVAIARAAAVGVDIETGLRAAKALRVGGHYFSPEEKAELAALGMPEAAALALRLWTLRESLVKAQGGSIWGGLGQIGFRLARGRLVLGSLPSGFPAAQKCWAVEGRIGPGLQIAMSVIDGSDPSIAFPAPVFDPLERATCCRWTPQTRIDATSLD